MATNKNTAARYAFIGLIVAAVGCVATGLLALVQGTVALKLFTPGDAQLIPHLIEISAAVLVIGLAVYGILNPDGVRRFLTGRQARYGSNALILAVAFIGILFVINLLALPESEIMGFHGRQAAYAGTPDPAGPGNVTRQGHRDRVLFHADAHRYGQTAFE